jgi:transcriptional regulator with XRE-family HTH domain
MAKDPGYRERVGNAIKARREQKGWTQSELAAKCGWSVIKEEHIAQVEAMGEGMHFRFHRIVVAQCARSLGCRSKDLNESDGNAKE